MKTGQGKESPAEEYEMPISSILVTNEDCGSAIIVRGEGCTMNTKQEFFFPYESYLPELPLAPLFKSNFASKNIRTPLNVELNIFNCVETTKPSSSDESSLLCNCSHSATHVVESPALKLSIVNKGTHPCQISNHDYCCAKADGTSTQLQQGMIQSYEQSFCDCDSSAIPNGTDNHMNRKLIHSDENTECCDVDGEKLLTKDAKVDHGINCAVQLFRCVLCSATYDEPVSLKQQMVTHSALKTFICDLWQKSSRRKDYLDRLNFVHSNVKPFNCERCSVTFDSESALKLHMVCHSSDVKTFNCKICNMSFKRKGGLKMHMVCHSDDKTFCCEHCNRSFKRKFELQQHKAIHSDIKPFRCQLCHRTFSRKHGLKMHNLVHLERSGFSRDAAVGHSAAENV